MRILVTDGDSRAALAVTRSLGRRGHDIVVGEKVSPSLAQTSRFCVERVVYPAPLENPDGFVDVLLQAVQTLRIDVLLPIADVPTLLVTQRREEFERHCLLPFASNETLERAANKADLIRTAQRLGVPVPRSHVISAAAGVADIAADLTFPVVIKPHRSRVRTAKGWTACAVGYATTLENLHAEVGRRPAEQFPLILQERIEGPGVGIFACYDHGRLIALFSHRRLREKPPWGGVSVLSESIAVSPTARQYAEALFKELAWHGVGMVEFKIDERDQLPKLMEINGRFWGSLQLAVDAGVDFPAILLDTVQHVSPVGLPEYRVGVRNRWFWGDVDSLCTRLFRRAVISDGLNGGRARAVVDFLQFWGRDLYYENPKMSDIRPWFFETAQWVKGLR